jgi:multiple sugar transport system substrate-binding protein
MSPQFSRRAFLRLVGTTTGAVVLAACQGATQAPTAVPKPAEKATEVTQPTSAPAAKGQTTVRLLTTHGATMAPFIAESLKKFAQEHPEVKVEHEDLTEGYYDRLNVMVASQTLPDVVNLRSFDMFDWYRLGNLHSVSEFLDAEPKLKASDMVDAIMRSCYFEGKYWGLPYDASTMIFFYNRDLLKQAGVEEPKDTWTIDEMMEMAKTLTQGDNWGFARLPDYADWRVEPWILAYGGTMINEARDQWTMVGEGAEAAMQLLVDMRKKYKVAPEPAAAGSINIFVLGKGGLVNAGQWEIPGNREALKFDWDVAWFPTGKAGFKSITHGGTYIMYAKTKVASEAWKVQRWICAEEDWQRNVYGKSGYSIPAYKPVAEEAWMAPINEGKPPKRAHLVIDQLAKSQPGALWPNYWKIAGFMSEELTKCFLEDVPVREALNTLKKRADEAIAEALSQKKLS